MYLYNTIVYNDGGIFCYLQTLTLTVFTSLHFYLHIVISNMQNFGFHMLKGATLAWTSLYKVYEREVEIQKYNELKLLWKQKGCLISGKYDFRVSISFYPNL